MKKNIFTLFMAAVMCLSMAACGAKKEEAPVAPPIPEISEPAASVEGPAADPGVGVPAEPTEGPVADVRPEVPAEPETPAGEKSSSAGLIIGIVAAVAVIAAVAVLAVTKKKK